MTENTIVRAKAAWCWPEDPDTLIGGSITEVTVHSYHRDAEDPRTPGGDIIITGTRNKAAFISLLRQAADFLEESTDD